MQTESIEFELRVDALDYIALNQLLKATGVAENGAMANELISEGYISVNGEVDTRKRAKIRKGDAITFEDQKIIII